MDRLSKLEHELTGAMTTRLNIKNERPSDEPPPPWWWRGDDDATEVNFRAMQQLAR